MSYELCTGMINTVSLNKKLYFRLLEPFGTRNIFELYFITRNASVTFKLNTLV